MLKNDSKFQPQLWQAIADIESQSQVEMVVIVQSRANDYPDVALALGVISAWLTHTYLVFVPILFTDWAVYFGPLLAFLLGWLLGKIPMFILLCVPAKRLQRNTEIMARALFQKGGIHHTYGKTGVLVYCAYLEKQVVVIADRGVELTLPAEEWQKLKKQLQGIFRSHDPLQALLAVLTASQAVFSQYLPAQPNNINELPDNLDIRL
jgi:putative membrane protein